jgi:7-cyano-7-deazaguanine synthase
MKKQAVLSLSGGMDSSTLLLHLLANDYDVTALSFDYGQKHRVELERAQSLVAYVNEKNCGCGGKPIYGNVKHQIIKLDGLSQLLNSSLVEGGDEVPEGHYEQNNMKETVVPNRNKIFSSVIQAVALSLATKPITDDCSIGQEVAIAMGIHAGDHAIYPDCREEFRDVDFEAFKIGNWDSELVYYYTPYLEMNKFDILQDGENACNQLRIDFNEVYKRTNTSYKPIQLANDNTTKLYDEITFNMNKTAKLALLPKLPFTWYSDYKSAASVERIEAFIKLGRPDPVAYADETGPVSWEVAKAHVEKVLAEHNS